jgi:hypothetical protein
MIYLTESSLRNGQQGVTKISSRQWGNYLYIPGRSPYDSLIHAVYEVRLSERGMAAWRYQSSKIDVAKCWHIDICIMFFMVTCEHNWQHFPFRLIFLKFQGQKQVENFRTDLLSSIEEWMQCCHFVVNNIFRNL